MLRHSPSLQRGATPCRMAPVALPQVGCSMQLGTAEYLAALLRDCMRPPQRTSAHASPRNIGGSAGVGRGHPV